MVHFHNLVVYLFTVLSSFHESARRLTWFVMYTQYLHYMNTSTLEQIIIKCRYDYLKYDKWHCYSSTITTCS